jgi:hypothetical protein
MVMMVLMVMMVVMVMVMTIVSHLQAYVAVINWFKNQKTHQKFAQGNM